MSPLTFLQYSPFIASCNQLALGVFQLLKAPFCQDLSKYTPSNSDAKFIELTLSEIKNTTPIDSLLFLKEVFKL